jgi:hypothetical protein
VAKQRGLSLSALAAEGLTLALAERQKARTPVRFPTSDTAGGPFPGIDLNDNAQLLDIMDGLK